MRQSDQGEIYDWRDGWKTMIVSKLMNGCGTPLDLWTYPAGVTALLARWTEKLAGGPQKGTSDSPPPALARGMGVVSQQWMWNTEMVPTCDDLEVIQTVLVDGHRMW